MVNRLLYLLNKRTTRQGFAFWTASADKGWVGFEGWRGLVPEPLCEARRFQLPTDPRASAAVTFGTGGWSSLPLPDLVAGLLAWLGGPLEFSDLAATVARLHEVPVPRFASTNEASEHEEAGGYNVDYDSFEPSAAAKTTLHPGRNVLAIHCYQTTSGQYVDAALTVV